MFMPENNIAPSEPRYFLRKKAHLYLTLAVIATTLISLFNVNSWCIILLVLCRLRDGPPRTAIRRAFSNKYFLAFFSIFALEVLGLLYTHDYHIAYGHIESKATLAAIPFVLCAGPFTDKAGRRRLMSIYCLLLFVLCLYCLFMAVGHYSALKDPSVFFYHTLTEVIGVNAVFYSGYVVIALLFLLSHPLYFGPSSPGVSSPQSHAPRPGDNLLRVIRIGLIIFFTGMMILLSSKLLLILLVILLISFLLGRRRFRVNPAPFLGLGLLLLIGTGMLLCTDNPVVRRYKDIGNGDIGLFKRDSFPSGTVYNGLSLRLVIWKFSYEILNEKKAWVIGVTSGDSQRLLNDKYRSTGMSQGYLSYNFHNQYIEEMVRSGIVGLCIFLAACWMLIVLARETGTKEAWFTIVMVLILYLTESMLEMQHSTFFSCFFPLLLAAEATPLKNFD
jgi:MFS family permease